MSTAVTPEYLLREADRCVKCGYCLPACPTYGLLADEADSPRGRIALIQGLASGALDADSPTLWLHLDRCIGCRACEPACPSDVRYGLLLDAARAFRQQQHPSPSYKRLLDGVAGGKLLDTAALSLRLYRHSGLQKLARRFDLITTKSLRQLERMAPLVERKGTWRTTYPAVSGKPRRGRVGLFVGCIGQLADRNALDATITVLTRLGFEVVVPKQQTCCGALHRHNGFLTEADERVTANRRVLAEARIDAVVSVASACCAELREHGEIESAREISSFLAELPPDALPLRPMDAAVAVHEPCSQRNLLRDQNAVYEVLGRIPGIRLTPLAENAICCGAGGSYFLTQPELSNQLGARKARHLADSGARVAVTSNTGCALQLAASAREAGLDIEILHPVELIARQLDPKR